VKWKSGVGMDNGAGLAMNMNECTYVCIFYCNRVTFSIVTVQFGTFLFVFNIYKNKKTFKM